jgi:hypothetical protein
MKPGGRRAGEVDRDNTVFTTPTNARGRRSLGRQSLSTPGGLDLFGTHTQLAQEDIGLGTLIREVWVGLTAP